MKEHLMSLNESINSLPMAILLSARSSDEAIIKLIGGAAILVTFMKSLGK